MENNFLNIKTIIIGSGISGISCSLNLLKNSYNDFILFEALDRIGGRIHSIDHEHSFLEIGAQFIHGQLNNPIYYIAREKKQIEEKYNEIIIDDENIEDNNGIPIDLDNESGYLFATQFGHKIDKDKAYYLYNIVNKLIREAKDYYLDKNIKNSGNDKSAGQFVFERYNQIIETRFKSNDTKEEKFLKDLIAGFLVWRCKSENIEIGCHSVNNISMENYCIFKDLEGSQIIELKNGYSKILSFLIETHQNEFNSKLRLKHALKKILICSSDESNCLHCLYANKDSNKIVAILNDLENKKDLIVICENIVCTMSLGYLKENLTNLIEPISFVSNEKQMAVSRIGYGTVNKIFFFYEKPFWDESLSGLEPIWLLDENKGETILNKLDKFDENNWFESISYFTVQKDHKNVLCAWLSGCEFFEKFSNEKISNDCTLLLRKFLNNNNIPEPIKILKSNWNSDCYFKGSYSFLPIGSNGITDLNNLAEPIYGPNQKPVVMFAGEATSQDQFSTVHGAYFTGIRESERILKL